MINALVYIATVSRSFVLHTNSKYIELLKIQIGDSFCHGYIYTVTIRFLRIYIPVIEVQLRCNHRDTIEK